MEEVDAVNRLYAAGTLTFDEALKKLVELKNTLYKARDSARPKAVFHSQNAKILNDYWGSEYADRDIIDPERRRTELKWAVAGVGMFSLAVASRDDLQAAVNEHFSDPNRQRVAVARLNQVLKWLGRGFILRKKREVFKSVHYLTIDELEQVLPHLKDPAFAALVKAAFATGCRLGELFPLTEVDYKGSFLWVETQIDSDSAERETKNRKRRKAFVLKERREWVTEWLQIASRRNQRLRKHSTIFKRACAKAFPDQEEKHLTFHDLRHSYAVYLLQVKGATIQLVANSLGNGVQVCEKYYAGFVLTDPGIDYLERL